MSDAQHRQRYEGVCVGGPWHGQQLVWTMPFYNLIVWGDSIVPPTDERAPGPDAKYCTYQFINGRWSWSE